MIDKFYYAAHDYIEGNQSELNQSKRVVFGEGVYANYNDLRDYAWTYSVNKYSIYNFSKESKEKSIPCVFMGNSRNDTVSMRNHAYEVFDRDCRLGKQGRIVINGYYLNCNIVAAKNSNYLMKRRIDTQLTVVCSDPSWHRDVLFNDFRKTSSQSSGNELSFDFPIDFPFDFGPSKDTNGIVITNDCLVSCPFKIIIQGPCENPTIQIAEHTYKVNGTIAETETLEIVSIKDKDRREIIKYGIDGSSENWFGHRHKESSIFEEIPSGNVSVIWDGTFDFDLILYQERSEPPWELIEEKEVEKTYLLDAFGSIILDAYGEMIEIGG